MPRSQTACRIARADARRHAEERRRAGTAPLGPNAAARTRRSGSARRARVQRGRGGRRDAVRRRRQGGVGSTGVAPGAPMAAQQLGKQTDLGATRDTSVAVHAGAGEALVAARSRARHHLVSVLGGAGVWKATAKRPAHVGGLGAHGGAPPLRPPPPPPPPMPSVAGHRAVPSATPQPQTPSPRAHAHEREEERHAAKPPGPCPASHAPPRRREDPPKGHTDSRVTLG